LISNIYASILYSMNIHKLVHNSKSPHLDLENSRLHNSRLHNYSKSQNLTCLRPKQADKSLKSSFKENQQPLYRISSVLMNQPKFKPQKPILQIPRYDKSLAVFCTNRDKSQPKNPNSSLSQNKIVPEFTKKFLKPDQSSFMRTKVVNSKEQQEAEGLPQTVSTLPHKGLLMRNLKAGFPLSHGCRSRRLRKSVDRHPNRKEAVLRTEGDVKGQVS
jgi:hypothetical protein